MYTSSTQSLLNIYIKKKNQIILLVLLVQAILKARQVKFDQSINLNVNLISRDKEKKISELVPYGIMYEQGNNLLGF